MKKIIVLLALFTIACNQQQTFTVKDGVWLATLDLGSGNSLPFNIIASNGTLTISNAAEQIVVDEITIKGDSISIQPPSFEGVFKGVFKSATVIQGVFSKPSLDRNVPFKMEFGVQERFKKTTATVRVDGVWETVFSPDNTTESYIAKGVFKQEGNKVTGTFETTTGDYRYLEGVVSADSLYLSTFDSAHAFLFKAKITGDSFNGVFYSGNHWQEPFTGKRNASYQLPDALSLTYLKDGYDKLSFSFPDKNGDMISLQDARFKEKVVIVQLMGSWCPNCLDETKFYVEQLKNPDFKDVQVIALAFETAPTAQGAFKAIARMSKKSGVNYPILLAQYGGVDKNDAALKLPALNHVLSYPTSIYIDKKGVVRRVHTGFDGPATGSKHDRFKASFASFLTLLTSE